MLPHPPPLALSAAPSINIPGLTCTGTIYDTGCGSHVKYECDSKWSKYDFERLLDLRSWIIFGLIAYSFQLVSTGDPYQRILGLLAIISPGSARALQPRSKLTRTCALLVYLGILRLVWIWTPVMLSEDWQMMRAAFVEWRPSLTPLRSGLVVLYPMWMVMCIYRVVYAIATIASVVLVTTTQIRCIKTTAPLITGRRQLDESHQHSDSSRGNDLTRDIKDGLEKKQGTTESTKMPAPLSEKNQA
ncbi:hypothetical protein GQX73_g6029 [Xylaria multiplex]|uniref:Uncharacterized protein n=1 Tax=Xylaria multiplex TaxID=323545 RepID=A0A7C8ML02_9PEZI|nr:hypothetical protein GQX73_g6029 [Xylaria multiplex]